MAGQGVSRGWTEGVMLGLCLVIVFGYHFWYFKMIKNNPSGTVYGLGKQIRREWIKKCIGDQKYAILGVQTCRNELLTGQFLAQASFVALSLVVGASSSTNLPLKLELMGNSDPIVGREGIPAAPILKLALLTVLLGAVFVNSVQHLRIVRHVSMYMGLRLPGGPTAESEGLDSKILCMYERSTNSFWYAMRCMILLFPAVAWLFGATYALIASVGSILFMAMVDNLNFGEDIQKLRRRGSIRRSMEEGAARGNVDGRGNIEGGRKSREMDTRGRKEAAGGGVPGVPGIYVEDKSSTGAGAV